MFPNVLMPADLIDDEALSQQGMFRMRDGTLMRVFIKKYPRDLWQVLSKFGVTEDLRWPEAACFNARLIKIHNECLGRSRLQFELAVEELEQMWERFRLSDDTSFEQFLSEVLTYRQVHEPTDDAVAAVDVVRKRNGIAPYRLELEQLNRIRHHAVAHHSDPDEAYGVEAEVMISFVDYASTVGMEAATCAGWECLAWAVRYRQTSYAVLNDANWRLNELLKKAFADGAADALKRKEPENSSH